MATNFHFRVSLLKTHRCILKISHTSSTSSNDISLFTINYKKCDARAAPGCVDRIHDGLFSLFRSTQFFTQSFWCGRNIQHLTVHLPFLVVFTEKTSDPVSPSQDLRLQFYIFIAQQCFSVWRHVNIVNSLRKLSQLVQSAVENNSLTIEPVAMSALPMVKASAIECGGPKWVVTSTY